MDLEGRWRLYVDAQDVGLLPDPVNWRVQIPATGVGGFDLTYPLNGLRADVLLDDLWCALGFEVMDSAGGWSEPKCGRFIPFSRTIDYQAGTLQLKGASVGWLLGKAVRWPIPGDDVTGWKHSFPGVTPGGIARWMLNEATRRRALQNVTWDFDHAVDSDGNVWRDAYDAEYELGVTVRQIVDGLDVFGTVWRTDGWTVQLAQDRFADVPATSPLLIDGRDVDVQTLSVSLEDAAGEVLMTGNQRWGAARDSDVATWGRWQVSVSASGLPQGATLTAAAQRELSQRGAKITTQVDLLPDAKVRPFTDLWPGQSVTVITEIPVSGGPGWRWDEGTWDDPPGWGLPGPWRWDVSLWDEPDTGWWTGAAWYSEVNAEVTEIVLTHEGRATITVGEVTGSATDLLTRSVRAITGGRVARRPATGIN